MDLLNISSYFSLIVQFITGVISFDGLFFKLKKEDQILQDALKLETFVQLIEFIFYIYLVYSLRNNKISNDITSTRYIDWAITTPTMLVSTIMYLRYQENQEKKLQKPIEFMEVLKNDKSTIKKILVGNWLMLLFGYLGEINVIDQKIGVTVGFIFFSYTFKLLYSNYGTKSIVGSKLYYFMFGFWSIYGVAAVFDFVIKNTTYNILDIFAKNFYGLFLYYIIKSKSIN